MDGKDLLRLKTAQPDHDAHRLIAERWSPYGFSAEPISPRELASLFEAASWAASSFNEQPWRYVVASKTGDPEGFAKLLGLLTPKNQHWAKHAPVLAVSLAKRTFAHNGKPNRVALHDLGAASATLTFEASARGLFVHQMAGIDVEAARHVLSVPEDFDVGAAIAIGYLADPADVEADLMERQSKPRTRKPLDELIFTTEWGRPADFV